MGAEREREDTDPTSKGGTEPGLGPASDPNTAATVEDELPPPVDFDALHAALGDPLDLDDLPPAAHEVERAPPEPHGGDSSGRSSATYASARPHTIPPTRAPAEDLNAPAVIVATEALDTVPSAAPKMTIPVRGAPAHPNPQHGMPIPHGPPSSGPHPAAPPASFPATPPQGFPPQRHVAQMTVRMPERPIHRRPKSPTVVVRARGPSPRQKLVAFAAMLMLFTAGGIALVVWLKPQLVGLEPEPKPAPSASVIPSAALAPPPATTSAASTASVPAPSTSATAPATPKKQTATPPKPPTPTPAPTTAAPPKAGGAATF